MTLAPLPPRQDPPGDDIHPELDDWLAACGWQDATLQQLAGDISARRYLRLRRAGADETALLAVYPPSLADAYARFERATGLLTGVEVRVPRILETDVEARFMLLEDLGPSMLHEALSDTEVSGHGPPADAWIRRRPWFVLALEAGRRIATLPVSQAAALGCEPLDADLLSRELQQTRRAFFDARDLLQDAGLARDFDTFLDATCGELQALPPATCHRDFMVRNLVPLLPPPHSLTANKQLRPDDLAVIDYQDLRPGPPVYDLASLLNDTLLPPPEVEAELLRHAGIAAGSEPERPYRLAAVQRTLKAVGSYAASGHHLRRIPATLARTLYHLRQLPEAKGLVKALEQSWRSALAP